MEFLSKENSQYYHWLPIFTVMLGTGMRVGEITGLRWNDIDLKSGIIDVNHTLVYYKHRDENGCYFDIHSPKTKAGVRQIPMTEEVKNAFLLEKKMQELAGIQSKVTIDGYHNFIFVNRFGNVQNQGTLNRALRRIIRDCNDKQLLKEKNNPVLLPNFSCHSLRHTFTTRLVEAGVDIIDTAMSPFAMGTSQPATEVMVETFRGTKYDTGYDQNLLAEITDYFTPIREEALKSGLLNPKVLGVNIKTLQYQVPGGMLSNLVSQLKEAGQEDKYRAVLEEIPRVRKDFGEPPLVTPSSQIVGTQAVMNVIMGERYKMVPKESKKIMLGEFGQTVKPFNPEVQKKIIGDETPITCRPADLIAPQMPQFEKECAQWKQQDEDVLSYALFPNVAKEFFQYREAQQKKVDAAVADKENKAYPV